ncbi:hypothetical protein B0T18DRAFT_413726 [Schizothecium vesticola]|uniref:Uncharacterized protein n=1 Tax=Schizothecium vesticola TaxID=314040 RepID=A0AA40K1S0_9PEZI|nr:hypothetical protein B0T18DRAFT_413726 [Schizothecium vesticola]
MSLGNSKVLAHVDDDDQRSIPKAEIDELTKRSGKNLRGYMPNSQVGQVNRLEAEMMEQRRAEAMKKDPTLAATLNGNRPAKGARIDKELGEKDEEMVRKMEARKERKRSEGMLRVENRG